LERDRTAQETLYQYTYTEIGAVVSTYAKDRSEHDWIFNLGMLRVFTSLGKFKPGTNFLGWARTIIVRACIDHLRSNKSYLSKLSPIDTQYNLSSKDFESMMNSIDTEEIIALIQKLPVNQKLIFNLYEMEGYSHKEIHELTDININTSKWLLSKAKKTLREMITNSKDLKKYDHGQ